DPLRRGACGPAGGGAIQRESEIAGLRARAEKRRQVLDILTVSQHRVPGAAGSEITFGRVVARGDGEQRTWSLHDRSIKNVFDAAAHRRVDRIALLLETRDVGRCPR